MPELINVGSAVVGTVLAPRDVEALRSMDRALRDGTVARGGEGSVARAARRSVAAALLAVFEVVSEADDWLVCTPTLYKPDGSRSDLSEQVSVAKPHTLQRTAFDGQTIAYPGGQSITYTHTSAFERGADDGTDTEDQVITPAYYAGELIVAMRVGSGLTSGGFPLEWMDVNTAGRQWARVSG